MIRRGLVLGVAFVLGACATGGGMGQEPAGSMKSPDGSRCYQFERNEAADRLGLPWGFVLTEEPLGSYATLERFRAATLDGPTDRRDFPFAAWWIDPEEGTLKVGPEVTGSIQLELREEGRALVGESLPIGDAIPFGGEIDRTPTTGIVAQQVMCGANAEGA